MKYNCYVKHNGVLYAPGTDVPEGKAPKENTQPQVEEKVETVVEEKKEESAYSRTQIQQMNGTQLRELATQLGLEFGEDVTNRELKQMIMGKLGI